MKEREIETVYCTKYALTQGIFKVEGFVSYSDRFCCPSRMHQHFTPNEWSRSLDTALELAETLRQKKLISVQKQLDRLSKLEIKVTE